MEVKQGFSNGPVAFSDGGSGIRSLQPNYNSRAVREALEHLASIDLIELCNEAKIECCRATRDLRSCGRYVQYVLNSCGHASLCAECSQRYDFCPICRTPIPKNGNKLRLRLYYECVEAGLISIRHDERFQEREDGENLLNADVQHLFSLFDVALENNLVSLICHYVTDVCMDESAVSSDPVMAFLLDEVVVKNWCKRTFSNLVAELCGLYNVELKDMKSRSSLLLRYSTNLAGMSSVLDVLESSVGGSLSPQFHELHQLHESILKTKQHLDVMMWCIRHEFLVAVSSRYHDYTHWRSLVRERKSAAVRRSWPDAINHSTETCGLDGSLFIEDAIANLEIVECTNEMGDEAELFSLQKTGGSLFLRAKLEGLSGCYPFESLRAAVDMLFLCGSSDLVVAKQAILLYYLYDRHWTLPDDQWRAIIDDFAASFCVTRHSLLESLTFYLLDDHTNEALKEACRLLPEISGSAMHPKIAQVLLERDMPDIALMVLRWSGRDGGSYLISLPEAVTAVRVRVECGQLTEAFTYQRTICNRVREKKLQFEAAVDPSSARNDECKTWMEWIEILVTEICCLCIRRKLVDRMIELPWNTDEEKYLRKCLLDYATDGPSTITGNLLVVFYLQRCRYFEAYQVDRELHSLEQDFISNSTVDEDFLFRMQEASSWRTELVSKCIELLPDVQQQQIKSGKLPLPDVAVHPEVVEVSEKAEPQVEQRTSSLSSSFPLPVESPLILNKEIMMPSIKQSAFETPVRATMSRPNFSLELGKPDWPSVSCDSKNSLVLDVERGSKPQFGADRSVKHDTSVSGASFVTPPSSLQRFSRSSAKFVHQKRHIQESSLDHVSAMMDQSGLSYQIQSFSNLYSQVPRDNHLSSPVRNQGLMKSGKRLHSDTDNIRWNASPSDDLVDISRSVEKAIAVEGEDLVRGPRWRSDETSDDEEESPPQRSMGIASYRTPVTGIRRNRFARR